MTPESNAALTLDAERAITREAREPLEAIEAAFRSLGLKLHWYHDAETGNFGSGRHPRDHPRPPWLGQAARHPISISVRTPLICQRDGRRPDRKQVRNEQPAAASKRPVQLLVLVRGRRHRAGREGWADSSPTDLHATVMLLMSRSSERPRRVDHGLHERDDQEHTGDDSGESMTVREEDNRKDECCWRRDHELPEHAARRPGRRSLTKSKSRHVVGAFGYDKQRSSPEASRQGTQGVVSHTRRVSSLGGGLGCIRRGGARVQAQLWPWRKCGGQLPASRGTPALATRLSDERALARRRTHSPASSDASRLLARERDIPVHMPIRGRWINAIAPAGRPARVRQSASHEATSLSCRALTETSRRAQGRALAARGAWSDLRRRSAPSARRGAHRLALTSEPHTAERLSGGSAGSGCR